MEVLRFVPDCLCSSPLSADVCRGLDNCPCFWVPACHGVWYLKSNRHQQDIGNYVVPFMSQQRQFVVIEP